jgi:hypothetical protein
MEPSEAPTEVVSQNRYSTALDPFPEFAVHLGVYGKRSVLALLSRIPRWKCRTIQLEPGRPNPEAVLVYQAGCALRCRGTVSIVASIKRTIGSWSSCPIR